MTDLIHYKKGTKGKCCGNCRYTTIRWWSKRIECTGYNGFMAVGKSMVCDIWAAAHEKKGSGGTVSNM